MYLYKCNFCNHERKILSGKYFEIYLYCQICGKDTLHFRASKEKEQEEIKEITE